MGFRITETSVEVPRLLALPLGLVAAVGLAGVGYMVWIQHFTALPHLGGPLPRSLPQAAFRDLTSGADLLARLKKGGLILYHRHFHTNLRDFPREPTKEKHHLLDPKVFENCPEQRPLSEYGRAKAVAVGQRMRALGVPIGRLASSPYCRCLESARLVYQREPDEVDVKLIYRGGGYSVEAMLENLRPYLARVPAPGTNDVVMAHSAQVDRLGTIPEGGTYVFEPGDPPRLIGKVTSAEWLEAGVDPRFLGYEAHKGLHGRQ